jgi:hypothetical protein
MTKKTMIVSPLQILPDDKNNSTFANTDSIIHKLVMVFAFCF